MKAREREAFKIAAMNRAAAMGRLMLGQLISVGWQDFLKETDPAELCALPRRKLRGGIVDVRERLESSVDKFYRDNFENMTLDRLGDLFDEVKKTIPEGLRMPLRQFEARFGRVKKKAILDTPPYATVSITLWGLQFEYPEHHLMSDIAVALTTASDAHRAATSFGRRPVELRKQLEEALSTEKASCRAGLMACFALIEASLNGLAWRMTHTGGDRFATLTGNQKKLLEDMTPFQKKLLAYPELVTGKKLWNEDDIDVATLLDLHKPFRDSLCHPSPFDAPAKFGGYDKLARVYGATLDVLASCVTITLRLLERLHRHVEGTSEPPHWMSLRLDTGDEPMSLAEAARALVRRRAGWA